MWLVRHFSVIRSRSHGINIAWGMPLKARTKFGIGIGIIVVSLSALAWMGAKESQTYYHTISELPTLNAAARAPAHPRGRRCRGRLDSAYAGPRGLRAEGRRQDPAGQLCRSRPAAGHV